MPKVILRCGAALTREQAANAWTEGSKKFWVAKELVTFKDGLYAVDLRFMDIGTHAATVPMNAEVNLPFGEYILGCGYGACKLRKRFRVDLLGVRWL